MNEKIKTLLCLVIAVLVDSTSSSGGIVRTWGGTGAKTASWGMTWDGSSNVYVVGGFYETVDFDPGPSDRQSSIERR